MLHHLITCFEDFQHLQNDVDELCNNQTVGNQAWKTVITRARIEHISRKRLTTVSPSLHVNVSVPEHVSSKRYLGVLFSSDLSWSNHVKDISSKARKKIGPLDCHFHKYASPATMRTLYTALIRPQLEYAVPMCDPHLWKGYRCIGVSSEVCYKILYKILEYKLSVSFE